MLGRDVVAGLLLGGFSQLCYGHGVPRVAERKHGPRGAGYVGGHAVGPRGACGVETVSVGPHSAGVVDVGGQGKGSPGIDRAVRGAVELEAVSDVVLAHGLRGWQHDLAYALVDVPEGCAEFLYLQRLDHDGQPDVGRFGVGYRAGRNQFGHDAVRHSIGGLG